ncbi:MAG: PAS domain-containing protein [Steroidobacteraceae bacterium]
MLIIDEQERLVDLNPAAEQLLGKAAADLVGLGAAELGLSACRGSDREGWLGAHRAA